MGYTWKAMQIQHHLQAYYLPSNVICVHAYQNSFLPIMLCPYQTIINYCKLLNETIATIKRHIIPWHGRMAVNRLGVWNTVAVMTPHTHSALINKWSHTKRPDCCTISHWEGQKRYKKIPRLTLDVMVMGMARLYGSFLMLHFAFTNNCCSHNKGHLVKYM